MCTTLGHGHQCGKAIGCHKLWGPLNWAAGGGVGHPPPIHPVDRIPRVIKAQVAVHSNSSSSVYLVIAMRRGRKRGGGDEVRSPSSFFLFCSEASLVRIETGLATGVGMGDTGKRDGVDEKLEGLSFLVITSFTSRSIGMNACSTEFLLGNDNFGKANPSNGLSLELLLSSLLSDGLVERGLQNKNMVPLI